MLKKYLYSGLIACALGLTYQAAAREFTSTSGQKLEAELISVSGETVTLKRSDGKTFSLTTDRFVDADRKYIAKWQEENKGKVPAHLKDKKPRMEMRVSTGKTSKDDDQISGYIDERKQKVRISVTMENYDAVYPITDAKLTTLVFGESPETKDRVVVFKQEFKGIDLPLNEEKSLVGKGFELWYDDRGAMYGYKYEGYLVFLEDAEGKILHETSIPGTVAKYLDEARKLNAGDVYGRDYKKRGSASLAKSVKNVR